MENEETKVTESNKKDNESKKSMAILSYIIPLIPYFVEKKDKFVRFHAVQGMNCIKSAVFLL